MLNFLFLLRFIIAHLMEGFELEHWLSAAKLNELELN